MSRSMPAEEQRLRATTQRRADTPMMPKMSDIEDYARLRESRSTPTGGRNPTPTTHDMLDGDEETHALLAEIQRMGRPTNIQDAQKLKMLRERLKLIASLREPTDEEDYERLRSRAPYPATLRLARY